MKDRNGNSHARLTHACGTMRPPAGQLPANSPIGIRFARDVFAFQNPPRTALVKCSTGRHSTQKRLGCSIRFVKPGLVKRDVRCRRVLFPPVVGFSVQESTKPPGLPADEAREGHQCPRRILPTGRTNRPACHGSRRGTQFAANSVAPVVSYRPRTLTSSTLKRMVLRRATTTFGTDFLQMPWLDGRLFAREIV